MGFSQTRLAWNGSRSSAAPAERPQLFPAGDLGTTKAKILDAAYRRLARQGYAALSTREIARDAGVNHALINYHFRTKDQLVIAVLDEANRQLLARQQQMYRGPGGFAEKWAQARRFYETDLASGFVRLQAELWAAGMSNAELREKFRPRIRAWKQVVLGGVREAFATAEACGIELPAPFTAEVDRVRAHLSDRPHAAAQDDGAWSPAGRQGEACPDTHERRGPRGERQS